LGYEQHLQIFNFQKRTFFIYGIGLELTNDKTVANTFLTLDVAHIDKTFHVFVGASSAAACILCEPGTYSNLSGAVHADCLSHLLRTL
jgi:hypothetical protein